MTSGLGTYLATCALPASILAGSPGHWIGTALVVVFAASVVLWPARGKK